MDVFSDGNLVSVNVCGKNNGAKVSNSTIHAVVLLLLTTTDF